MMKIENRRMEQATTTPSSTPLRHPPDYKIASDGHTSTIYVPNWLHVNLDEELTQLWKMADGRTVAELEAILGEENPSLLAQLAVLRTAGLLLPALPVDTVTTDAQIPNPVPLVSVVIVSRNGRRHLEECLPSILSQTYPSIEIVLVDDASTDNSEAYVREHFPDVKVVRQANGPNFAAGCNLGIAHSTGDFIFLLNNDTVLDPSCIEELVLAQAGRAQVGGVAAMMRFYDNRPFINGIGTLVRRIGFGHDVGIGNLDVGQFEGVAEIPFLCFGAALIPRSVLDIVGPIEEAYQFYYEDADWSYRARALGLRLIPAPRARLYHKFGGSVSALPSAFKLRLVTRNRLWFALKNFPITAIPLQLIFYWLDDLSRFLRCLQHGQWKVALAIAQAWMQCLAGLPYILRTRRRTWYGKTRVPVNLTKLAEPFPLPDMPGMVPRLTTNSVEAYYKPFLTQRGSGDAGQRLLIISPDTVDVNMGGVGIRYWELAHQLAEVTDVTLAVPQQTNLSSETFTIHHYEEGRAESLEPVAAAADTIVLSGFTVYHHPFLRHVPQRLVIDLYDPMILENLERFSARPMAERNGLHQMSVATFNELFTLGDFFICATEKQRDYWLGALSAANRVNPTAYSVDPTLRRLIDTVPFGLPDSPPRHTRKVLKGVWPGIGSNDKVILWGGGLWDWLDPLTVIEAMPYVLQQVPEARLFFLGTKHPNPAVPPSRMALQALERAEALGLKDRAIFFNDWTPYQERVNYLCEADVGVSLHGNHIETHFSVRTRLMDYLWAQLPMVVTGGDVLSDLVREHQLGCIVAAGDVEAVVQGLIQVLQFPVEPYRFEPVVAMFYWSKVAEPLKQYMQMPWDNGAREGRGPAVVALKPAVTPLRQLPAKAVASMKERGLGGLWRDIQSYFRWIWQH